jgi:hypothetical protein
MVAGRGESVGEHLLSEWGGGSSFGPSPLEPLCPGEIFADQRSLERNNFEDSTERGSAIGEEVLWSQKSLCSASYTSEPWDRGDVFSCGT